MRFEEPILKQRYSRFQSFIQKFATTRVGAWFIARSAHHADRLYFRLSKGRKTLASIVSGIPVVMLTTTGARSGLGRTSPVLCVRDSSDPERFAVIASNLGQRHNPAWFYNLKANPRATGTINSRTRAYIAHEANEDEYARFWEAALEIYPGYQAYQQRAGKRRIPIMVLTPEEQISAPSLGT